MGPDMIEYCAALAGTLRLKYITMHYCKQTREYNLILPSYSKLKSPFIANQQEIRIIVGEINMQYPIGQ